MADYLKPLPTLNAETAPFWAALNRRELRFQQCRRCGSHRYPIAPVCPRCLDAEFDWALASGRGRVFSYVIFHRAYHRGFEADVPYNVALIALDEGVFMFSNIVGIANDAIRCDIPVMIEFDRVTDTITLPRFRPVSVP
ncbi:MAG: OB-fold domain-containing protein [Rhodospirillales bacterium]|nr:OB-fold domain-containing protein [Rhodospirillales bacterium]